VGAGGTIRSTTVGRDPKSAFVATWISTGEACLAWISSVIEHRSEIFSQVLDELVELPLA
jgi:hypothetical protein